MKGNRDGDTGDRYAGYGTWFSWNLTETVKASYSTTKQMLILVWLERICSVMQNTGSNFEIDAIKRFKDEISGEFPEPMTNP